MKIRKILLRLIIYCQYYKKKNAFIIYSAKQLKSQITSSDTKFPILVAERLSRQSKITWFAWILGDFEGGYLVFGELICKTRGFLKFGEFLLTSKFPCGAMVRSFIGIWGFCLQLASCSLRFSWLFGFSCWCFVILIS